MTKGTSWREHIIRMNMMTHHILIFTTESNPNTNRITHPDHHTQTLLHAECLQLITRQHCPEQESELQSPPYSRGLNLESSTFYFAFKPVFKCCVTIILRFYNLSLNYRCQTIQKPQGTIKLGQKCPKLKQTKALSLLTLIFGFCGPQLFQLLLHMNVFFLQNLISNLCLAKGSTKFYQPNEQGGYCGFGQK